MAIKTNTVRAGSTTVSLPAFKKPAAVRAMNGPSFSAMATMRLPQQMATPPKVKDAGCCGT